jgi:hypothetical protein
VRAWAVPQEEYRAATGIGSLKVRRTAQEGFAIEVAPKWQEALYKACPEATVLRSLKVTCRESRASTFCVSARSRTAAACFASAVPCAVGWARLPACPTAAP